MEAIGKFLEQLGYGAPVLYSGIAYGFFYWLDENLSDAAKAALASTTKLRSYGKEQVASALVEVFDQIYTSPLLSWRAFVRSLLFTTVVSAIYLFESSALKLKPVSEPPWYIWLLFFLYGLLFNVFTDRHRLRGSGCSICCYSRIAGDDRSRRVEEEPIGTVRSPLSVSAVSSFVPN
jgi:hypothetical protein